MKLNLTCFTKIAPLAFVVALPFAAVSCGEKEEEKQTGTEAGTKADDDSAKQSHTEIGKEVSAVMASLMEEMSQIKDVETAQKFVDGFGATKEKLKGLVEAAKELDAPTAEEKAEVQAMKEAADAKAEELFGGFMKMMSEDPNAEAIGAVMGKAMNDSEMEELTEDLSKIYDLEEGSDEVDPGSDPETE